MCAAEVYREGTYGAGCACILALGCESVWVGVDCQPLISPLNLEASHIRRVRRGRRRWSRHCWRTRSTSAKAARSHWKRAKHSYVHRCITSTTRRYPPRQPPSHQSTYVANSHPHHRSSQANDGISPVSAAAPAATSSTQTPTSSSSATAT